MMQRIKLWARVRGERRVLAHIRAHCEVVRPVPVAAPINFQCHRNCVEYLRAHPGGNYGSREVIYVDGGSTILHYLVEDRRDGQLLEVTLGHECHEYQYFSLVTVPDTDIDRLPERFDEMLKYWRRNFSTWFERAICRVERVV